MKLTKPDLSKPAFKIFPKTAKSVEENKCPTCGNAIGIFKDSLSEKEYSISGMCQSCQDVVFNN